MELNGSRVLVTGASGGIGDALVEQLCTAGAQVLAVGRDAEKLAAAQGRFPHALRALAADLATPAGVDAVAAAARDFGGVDCVVQAAGLNRFGLVEQQDDAAIAAQVALNLVAPMLLTRRLLPLLRERPRALVLFVGSTFGAIGYPGFAPYSATKFGLRGFAEALRRELADGPVRVLYLAPRATRTAMNAGAVVEMNRALRVAMDPPAQVAAAIVQALRDESPERHLGWPERFFARLNRLLPRVVDRALRGQLATIQRFAHSEPEENRP
jgi:short-subunit dehydrogenase